MISACGLPLDGGSRTLSNYRCQEDRGVNECVPDRSLTRFRASRGCSLLVASRRVEYDPPIVGMAGAVATESPLRPSFVKRNHLERRRTVDIDPLLSKVAAGDSQAIRACADRFAGLVWSLARRMSFSGAEADDAVQDVFVEIWKNAYRYDSAVASETAFVAMIARRRLIDRRRMLSRRPDRQPLPEAEVRSDVSGVDTVSTSEEATKAAMALESLSPEQQRVIRLSIFHGLSHEKIATSTGLPMGTVKTHARRGLIRLRELLEAGRPRSGPRLATEVGK